MTAEPQLLRRLLNLADKQDRRFASLADATTTRYAQSSLSLPTIYILTNRLPFSILSLRIRSLTELQWVIVKTQSITVVDEVEEVSEVD